MVAETAQYNRDMTSRPDSSLAGTSSPRHRLISSSRHRHFVLAVAACALLGQQAGWGATAASTAPSICTLPGANTTTVAAVRPTAKEIKVFTKPETTAPSKTLTNWVDVKGRVVFNVLSQQGDFLDVKVPAKPNGAHGFVKAAEVTTFQHSCRIVIELAARRLTAYRGDEVLLQDTVAVGAPQWPTPTGTFYTTALLKPIKRVKGKKVADPAFGPFAYTLSGFSETPGLENFGGGKGTLGIHGTSAPELLGQAVSHGCIRINNAAITKLAKLLPIGVPVEIKA